MGLRLHLLMCKLCPQFLQQLLFIREAAKRYTGKEEGGFSLSPEVRERIKRSLKDQNKEAPSRNNRK
jgi:hypothetical protein